MDNENRPPAPIETNYEWSGKQPRFKEIGDRIRFLKESARGHIRWSAINVGTGIFCIGTTAFSHSDLGNILSVVFGSLVLGISVFEAGKTAGDYMEASALTTTLANHYLEEN